MALRWTEEEYEAWRRAREGDLRRAAGEKRSSAGEKGREAGEKRSKYGNRRVEVDGKKFDSVHEAEVYGRLTLLHRAGALRVVMRQVPFDLPGGIRYIADFATVDADGRFEVWDAKSEITRKNRVYINKKKQMLEIWGIAIREE